MESYVLGNRNYSTGFRMDGYHKKWTCGNGWDVFYELICAGILVVGLAVEPGFRYFGDTDIQVCTALYRTVLIVTGFENPSCEISVA